MTKPKSRKFSRLEMLYGDDSVPYSHSTSHENEPAWHSPRHGKHPRVGDENTREGDPLGYTEEENVQDQSQNEGVMDALESSSQTVGFYNPDEDYNAELRAAELERRQRNQVKKARKKKKQQEKRQIREQTWRQELLGAQKLLGLHPQGASGDQPNGDATASTSSEGNVSGAQNENASVLSGIQNSINTHRDATNTGKNDVVFVCIDVECLERNHSAITEVGISTLDTRDLQGIALREDGSNWIKKIKAQHFITREYIGRAGNGEFITCYPHKFQFGTSVEISHADIFKYIMSAFPEDRNVVFVGHNISSDIDFLQNVGFSPSILGDRLVQVLDTVTMYQVWKNGYSNSPSLSTVMEDLGVTAWFLHNAGNDAYYSLMAMVMIAVRVDSVVE